MINWDIFWKFLLPFLIGFVMNYIFRKFQNFSISVYNKKVYKEDYIIIPTDVIFFLVAFFYYNEPLKILFMYLGFIFNPISRKLFLNQKGIDIKKSVFTTLSFFIPLFFMCLILKIFVSSLYQFYFYLLAFGVYIFLNKFLSMAILDFLGKVNYGGIFKVLKRTFRFGFSEGFLFFQFIFTYLSFIFLIEKNFFNFIFLIIVQFIFLRLLYFSNILLDSYQSLIDTLLNLLQEYDTDTYEHSERVASLAKILAKNLGLAKDEIDSIYLASKLHDIGKIDTPSFILNKEGKLTKTEFKIITLHPLIASQIVENIVSEKESKFIKYHHFYPTVFNKPVTYEDIPLGARIIMVADVYDALRSKRKYKPSLSHQEAINEMVNMIQKKLIDPKIFKTLVDSFQEYKDIYEK